MTGIEIKKMRRTFCLTRKDFAGLLGVTIQTIYFWETDAHKPSGVDGSLLRVMFQIYKQEGQAKKILLHIISNTLEKYPVISEIDKKDSFYQNDARTDYFLTLLLKEAIPLNQES